MFLSMFGRIVKTDASCSDYSSLYKEVLPAIAMLHLANDNKVSFSIVIFLYCAVVWFSTTKSNTN